MINVQVQLYHIFMIDAILRHPFEVHKCFVQKEDFLPFQASHWSPLAKGCTTTANEDARACLL